MSAARAQGQERGRPEQRAAFVAGAVEHVLGNGVATLSLRPLASALGTSDRMLLYYFGSRERLVTTVLAAVGEQLQDHLARALPARRLAPARFVADAEAALRAPAVEPHLRLYVEVVGLAVRGQEPFAAVAGSVAEGWRAWVDERLDVPDADRAVAASAVLTVLDGLLLLRFLVSPGAAEHAAGWLSAALRR